MTGFSTPTPDDKMSKGFSMDMPAEGTEDLRTFTQDEYSTKGLGTDTPDKETSADFPTPTLDPSERLLTALPLDNTVDSPADPSDNLLLAALAGKSDSLFTPADDVSEDFPMATLAEDTSEGILMAMPADVGPATSDVLLTATFADDMLECLLIAVLHGDTSEGPTPTLIDDASLVSLTAMLADDVSECLVTAVLFDALERLLSHELLADDTTDLSTFTSCEI